MRAHNNKAAEALACVICVVFMNLFVRFSTVFSFLLIQFKQEN